jgi:hypothetical protein
MDDGAAAPVDGDVADAIVGVVGLGPEGVFTPEVAAWHAQTRSVKSARAENRTIMCTSCLSRR